MAPVMSTALRLFKLMLNTLTSPAAMTLGVKALATVGATAMAAPVTVSVAAAEAPAPALLLLTVPLLLL